MNKHTRCRLAFFVKTRNVFGLHELNCETLCLNVLKKKSICDSQQTM